MISRSLTRSATVSEIGRLPSINLSRYRREMLSRSAAASRVMPVIALASSCLVMPWSPLCVVGYLKLIGGGDQAHPKDWPSAPAMVNRIIGPEASLALPV